MKDWLHPACLSFSFSGVSFCNWERETINDEASLLPGFIPCHPIKNLSISVVQYHAHNVKSLNIKLNSLVAQTEISIWIVKEYIDQLLPWD